jgi:hypothetical protein
MPVSESFIYFSMGIPEEEREAYRNRGGDKEMITAKLSALHIFSVRGLLFRKTNKKPAISDVFTVSRQCRAVLSESQDDGISTLIGSDYINFEKSLIHDLQKMSAFVNTEEKTDNDSPDRGSPYLLLSYLDNELSEIEINPKYKKEKDGNISFWGRIKASQAYLKWREESLPAILSNFSISVYQDGIPVYIKPISVSCFGVTANEKFAIPYYVEANFSSQPCNSQNIDSINQSLESLCTKFRDLPYQVCRLFQAAQEGENKAGRFLLLFNCIEILCEKTQEKSARNEDERSNINRQISEIQNNEKPSDRNKLSKNVARFYWCRRNRWKNLDKDDDKLFLDFSDERNNLAHGDYISESELPEDNLEKLEMFVFRVLRSASEDRLWS